MLLVPRSSLSHRVSRIPQDPRGNEGFPRIYPAYTDERARTIANGRLMEWNSRPERRFHLTTFVPAKPFVLPPHGRIVKSAPTFSRCFPCAIPATPPDLIRFFLVFPSNSLSIGSQISQVSTSRSIRLDTLSSPISLGYPFPLFLFLFSRLSPVDPALDPAFPSSFLLCSARCPTRSFPSGGVRALARL